MNIMSKISMIMVSVFTLFFILSFAYSNESEKVKKEVMEFQVDERIGSMIVKNEEIICGGTYENLILFGDEDALIEKIQEKIGIDITDEREIYIKTTA